MPSKIISRRRKTGLKHLVNGIFCIYLTFLWQYIIIILTNTIMMIHHSKINLLSIKCEALDQLTCGNHVGRSHVGLQQGLRYKIKLSIYQGACNRISNYQTSRACTSNSKNQLPLSQLNCHTFMTITLLHCHQWRSISITIGSISNIERWTCFQSSLF